MDEKEIEVQSEETAHAYDSDTCPDEADAQSVASEDSDIFHECEHTDDGDNEKENNPVGTTEDDPPMFEAQATERVGNIQIIEEQKNDVQTVLPYGASKVYALQTEKKTQHIQADAKIEENSTEPVKYLGNIQHCDLCKERCVNVPSSSYCLTCEESYCSDCAAIHGSQKATKEHILGPSKSNHPLFCSTCDGLGIKSPAVASCKECEELYCDQCSSVHKRQKATKSHTITTYTDLPDRITCEPCRENDQKNRQAYYFCIDCDEVQCYDCFCVHSKQKATKGHIIICSTENDDNNCKLCYKIGKKVLPDMYCRACAIKLCVECASIHRKHAATRDHKVLDIPNKPIKAEEMARIKEKPSDIVQESTSDNLKPGVPYTVGKVKLDSVCLAWDPPKHLFHDCSYQLRYKEETPSSKWTLHPDVASQTTLTLSNLKSNTKYVFQVRLISDERDGPYSDTSIFVETMQSAAARLINSMYEVKRSDIEMPLKKLAAQEKTRDLQGKSRKLTIGLEKKINKKERTIMLVGATGTGKSTLVDGMVNYILGVNWSDPYRLTLVDLEDDEKNRDTNQAVSQTQWITCYTLNPLPGSRLDYTLNIIDTPGFGDTRGIERDREIIEQTRTLFSKEDETGVVFIDAVCFLVKAPDARLTPTQTYIFNAIMSLFGQDIAGNICMLVTFADGKKPPVLSALKEANLPHEQHFPFNNSGLFADNSSGAASSFPEMFWKMGCESFRLFFEKLKTMDTKSLKQTRDVLEQREMIELNVENLQPILDAGLNKVEELRIEIRILNDYKAQIEDNSDFTYIVNETEQKQIDLPVGQHVTNCLTCNVTCHKICSRKNDEDKRKCMVMDRETGNCTQCGCFWNLHRNTPYIFEYVTVQKKKTYTEKLQKYRRAQDENITRQTVVERMHEELNALEQDILDLMERINQCNNVLKEIALRPDPLSVVEHIDLLIESEKLEKRAGFQGRISSLQRCRKKATIGEDVERFTTSFTDTKTIISGYVVFSNQNQKRNKKKKKKKKNKKGQAGIFQSVFSYFQD